MTELEHVRPGNAVVAFQPPPPSGSTLDVVPDMWILAHKVSRTSFAPKGLVGQPEGVFACLLAGHEAGLSPMQSLRSIHVVDGRPAMSAETMRAVIMRAGHEIWVDEEQSSNTKCTLRGQRAGSSRVSTVVWTIDDAKKANLMRKDNWANYPRAMLLARATTELARQLFPDVLAGISHTIEELSDGEPGDALTSSTVPKFTDGIATAYDGTPTEAPTPEGMKANGPPAASSAPAEPLREEKATRAAPPLPGEEDDPDIVDAEIVDPDEHQDDAEEPPPPNAPPIDDDPQVGEPDVEGNTRTMSGPQMVAIRFGDHGMKDRDDRLAACSALIGRDIESGNDLTPEETTTVLEFLAGDDRPLTLDDVVAHVLAQDTENAPESVKERRTAVNPATSWDEDRWRLYAKSQKTTIVKLIKTAQTLGAEENPPLKFPTLGDLVGSPIADLIVAEISGS